jgi:CRISPR-associated protein Csm5
LLNIASDKPNTDMLKALQRFFYERRQPLQACAINSIPVLPGIAALYDKRIGKPANREGDGKQVINCSGLIKMDISLGG